MGKSPQFTYIAKHASQIMLKSDRAREGTGRMINAVLHIDNNLLSLGSKLMAENAYGRRGKCCRIEVESGVE